MATCTVDAALRVPLADVGPGALDELRRALRVRNPAADRASPFARVAPWIEAVEVRDGEVIVPRGCTDVVRRVVRGVRFEDHRLSVPHGFTFAGELRPYQARAVEALLARENALLQAPTGSGKTEVLLATIARAGQRALVLVGSLELLEQWRDRARARLGVEPAIIGAGSYETNAPIVVATWQSLASDEKRLADLAQTIGCLVADEAHHFAAPTGRAIVSAFPARFRIGASATLDRSDGLGPVVRWYFGPSIVRVETEELLASGHTMRPTLRQVPTSFRYAYSGPSDWPKMLDALVNDADRNRQIADLAASEHAKLPVPTLILTGRVAHARDLADLVAQRGLRAAALTGDMGKRARLAILDAVRSGALDVVCSTQLFDEAIDAPSLGRLLLVFPSKSAGKLVQRIGRIVRPAPGKPPPVVIDLVDLVGPLRHQARQRERTWRETWGQRSMGRAA